MHKIAIFASGNGSNAENIVRRFQDGNALRTVIVLSDKANAGVHARMKALGVESVTLPADVWNNRPAEVIDLLERHGVELVALAGFMRKVHPAIVEMYEGRMLNLHPSLLPKYGGKGMYGHHVHEAVIAAGEAQSGATVHYVTDVMDGGEILLQGRVDVSPEDTPASLEAKVHEVEFDIYPRAIMMALNRLDAPKPEPASAPAAEPPVYAEGKAEPAGQREQWAEALGMEYDAAESERRAAAVSEPPVYRVPEPPAPPAGNPNAPMGNTEAERPAEPMPPTWMLWSIIMTVCCCFIPGIVAIVFSSQVSTRYAAGDLEGARRASRMAEGWIIASFVLGVLSATLYVPLMMISSAL